MRAPLANASAAALPLRALVMQCGRYYSADVWRDMYWMGVKLAKVMRDVWRASERCDA